jgi:DNA polymerase-3 subunit chi
VRWSSWGAGSLAHRYGRGTRLSLDARCDFTADGKRKGKAMTRIDFYILAAGVGNDRLRLTCRIAERAHGDGHRVLIHCPQADLARQLDRLLWTYREDSFLPHGLVGETHPTLTPVLISADGEPAAEDQVLINLGTEVPEFFARFERLCEPLDHEPGVLEAGRARWKYYSDCGYDLKHHEVR